MVVGVDGSPGSLAALRWAVDEADRRDATLEVVHTWQYPAVGEVAGLAAVTDACAALEGAAKEVLDGAVQLALQWSDAIVIDPVLINGDAAISLLRRARDADLLVVGSRGRGGFAGLLLGSVSQQCAHHAQCPLVVVPKAWQPS